MSVIAEDYYEQVKNGGLEIKIVSRNNFGTDGAQQIAQALIHPDTRVQRLWLWNNHIGDEGAAVLAGALKSNSTTLQELNLESNFIGEGGALALAGALKSNSTLQRVYLSFNNIGDEGVMALAEALKSNTTLQKLWLSNNKITCVGAAALAEALMSNPTTLQELDLGSNYIRNEGAIALAEALKGNRTLQVLWKLLSNPNPCNSIGVDHVRYAWKQAKKIGSKSLKLGLENNEIGKEGEMAVLEALKTDATLDQLDIYGNSISESPREQFNRETSAKRGEHRRWNQRPTHLPAIRLYTDETVHENFWANTP